MALDSLEATGKRRDYEDFRPTAFAPGGEEGAQPEYPWVARGPEPKDFLGNEFLLWLWHEAESVTGTLGVRVRAESPGAANIAVLLDKKLELHCAYGQTGHDTIRGDGPGQMPEARDALRSGKVPRKAGLVLNANGQQYSLILAAEQISVSVAKLPDVPDADSARALFEERIGLLADLCKTIDRLFAAFLSVRASSAWPSHVDAIQKWIKNFKRAA